MSERTQLYRQALEQHAAMRDEILALRAERDRLKEALEQIINTATGNTFGQMPSALLAIQERVKAALSPRKESQ